MTRPFSRIRAQKALRALALVKLPGMLAKVVWGVPYAGVDQSSSGVVVMQCQYGFKMFRFHVETQGPDTIVCVRKFRRVI